MDLPLGDGLRVCHPVWLSRLPWDANVLGQTLQEKLFVGDVDWPGLRLRFLLLSLLAVVTVVPLAVSL